MLFIFLTFFFISRIFGQLNQEYFDNGNLKLSRKDYAGAIADFKKFLEINPKDATNYYSRSAIAFYNIGIAKSSLEDYKGAIVDFSKAIEINSRSGFYIARGAAKYKLGDYRGAMEDYTAATKIDPVSTEAYSGRGVMKFELGDYIGAIEDFTSAIEFSPGSADAYFNRGLTKSRLEDYKGAIVDFDKAIEINPGKVFYTGRGTSKYKLGDYRGAINDYTVAAKEEIVKAENPIVPSVLPEKEPITEPFQKVVGSEIKSGPPIKSAIGKNIVSRDVVVFRVQFLTNENPLGSYEIAIGGNSYKTYEYFYNGAYRTCTGEFSSLASATDLRNILKKEGYPDAFVVAFRNNERSLDLNLFK